MVEEKEQDNKKQATDNSEKVKPGIYKHYKGKNYKVYFTATNSETREEEVVYQTMYGDQGMFARPKKMFLENVEVDGETKPRFEFISEAEGDDYENLYKRALADYQNLIKRSTEEKKDFVRFANERLIMELLPVYDNLKTAINFSDESVQGNGWAEGIKYVIKQFKDILEVNGIQEVRTVGEKFDHNKMEAVSEEETDDKKKDGLVAKELKAGYELNGKVIEPARVVVYKLKI
jgi:molecular chaperone GrpE